MGSSVRCNNCKFGDWGYRLKFGERLPCKTCIGFHNWEPEPTIIGEITIECPACGYMAKAIRKCPLTGYEYNSGWTTRCLYCGSSMKEKTNG
jgi:hypothetical protein